MMRCLTMLFALAMAVSVFAADQPEIDWGFEAVTIAGGLRDWRASSSNPFESVEVVSNDPLHVRSGTHAVKLVQQARRGDQAKIGHLYTHSSVPVKAGEPLTFSFWARGAGTVAGLVYLYQIRDGHEAFHSSGNLKPADDTATPALAEDDWQEYRYVFTTNLEQIKSVRFVIAASGTVYVDDAAVRNPSDASREKKDTSSAESLRPNLMTVYRAARSPTIDGVIAEGEYPAVHARLLHNQKKDLYPYPSAFATAYDADRFYLAARLTLPPGYELEQSSVQRDDPAMIVMNDTFYVMVRPDADPASREFSGVYAGITASGSVYDAWEEIGWTKGYCRRDATHNVNWQVVSKHEHGVWTVELSAPWRDLKMQAPPEQARAMLSFGFHLREGDVAWQLFSNWFDHDQAFGMLRFAQDEPIVSSPPVGQLVRGELKPAFEVTNPTAYAADYDLTYMVSTPRMVGGSVGSWVRDIAIDVREQEVIGGNTIYAWNRRGNVAARQAARERDASQLEKPGYYVLETESRVGDQAVFYQKLPFHFSPPVTVALMPIPSKEQIEATLTFHGALPEEKGKARITFTDATGEVALEHASKISADVMTLLLSMSDMAPGEYQVEAALVDKQGNAVASAPDTFTKWETPFWLAKRSGIEALEADWVPQPWTPVTVSDRTVSVWGRTFTFHAGSLLAGMTSQDQPLLAAPVTIKYVANGDEVSVQLGEPAIEIAGAGRVNVTYTGTSPYFDLTCTQTIEFDGLDLFEVQLSPRSPTQVEALWVDIPYVPLPLAVMQARIGLYGGWWHRGLVRDEDLLQPRRYENIWLGDDDIGCTWFTESYKGWLIHSGKPRVLLDTQPDRRTLKLMLINEPSLAAEPMQVTFGLQPSPFKPMLPAFRGHRVDNDFPASNKSMTVYMAHASSWNSGDSKPSPRSWEMFDEMIAHYRSRGAQVNPYIGAFYVTPWDYISRDAPFTLERKPYPPEWRLTSKETATRLEEFFYYQRDWQPVPPRWAYTPIETREEAFTVPSSSYTDFFVGSVERMLTETDFGGFFLDISCPSSNLDPEKGLAYTTKDGVTEGTFESLATRDFYKRLYYVFTQHRAMQSRPWLIGHNMVTSAPYVSFWDMTINGEELKPQRPYEFTDFCLQSSMRGDPMAIVSKDESEKTFDAYGFRAGFGGLTGIAQIVLPQYGYNPELRTVEHGRETLSITFLHNALVWPAYVPPHVIHEFWDRVEVSFGMGDTTFHPYWRNGVTSDTPSARVSYWKKRDREDYLVAVANWSGEPVTARVNLPSALQQIGSGADMESGETIALSPEVVIDIPRHDLRVFRVTAN